MSLVGAFQVYPPHRMPDSGCFRLQNITSDKANGKLNAKGPITVHLDTGP